MLSLLNKTWEVIFVNDGSTDRSHEVLLEIMKKFDNIKVIKFKKNFGQTAAFDAGFKASLGEVIVTMDADLQNDPNDIPKLLEKTGDYDVVYGLRLKRSDSCLLYAG